MRKMFVLVAVGLMMAGSAVAKAQIIDPTTGVMVDPSTDAADFASVAAGQPGNIGMELAAQATAQAQQMALDQAQNQAQNFQNQMDSFPDNDSTFVAAQQKTPKPTMTPNGGSFKNSVQVTIADSDHAAMIYYTTDGSKPTLNSPTYASPLMLTGEDEGAGAGDG